jgi:GAF domain-containing protein
MQVNVGPTSLREACLVAQNIGEAIREARLRLKLTQEENREPRQDGRDGVQPARARSHQPAVLAMRTPSETVHLGTARRIAERRLGGAMRDSEPQGRFTLGSV